MKVYGGILAALLVWLGALVLGGPAAQWDVWLSTSLYLGEEGAGLPFWKALTELGGWKVLIGISVLAFLFLLLRQRVRDAWLLAGIVTGVRVLVEVQKLVFARPRPELEHLAEVSSFSFPSGHAANALATYGALTLIFSLGLGARLALGVLVLLIGASRILLGVHWPSDVVGGWALAALCLMAARRLRSGVATPQ